ncbi:MAG: thioredoxin family protein [candidate division FCPU426 bacterium]
MINKKSRGCLSILAMLATTQTGCGQTIAQEQQTPPGERGVVEAALPSEPADASNVTQADDGTAPIMKPAPVLAKEPQVAKVTFVELGSVRCIPCKMMQPIMAEIEKEYGARVKVVFYDIWTEAGRPYAMQYQIRAIPTQIFLDQDGKEFHRHTGFYPKEEIDKVLKNQGMK